ncbi:DUF4173 domain-containing protein [Sagittula sp. S175]|uniref:DUF4153 domain-containing protein n=1 Tax=Sagittula sp. S175 TaxID=3415129 RepID=UPI003C7E3F59
MGQFPNTLTMDGWWLDDQAQTASRRDERPRRDWQRGSALAVLVLLADWLFRGETLGVSLALFAGILFAIATWDVPGHRKIRPALLVLVGSLPAIDYVQLLSVVFLLASLAAALVWARVRDEDPWLATGLAWLARLPKGWTTPLTPSHWRGFTPSAPQPATLRPLLRDWGFPLGGLMVFGGLILRANPLILQALDWEVDLMDLIERLLFWAGVALILWPLLDRTLPAPAALPSLPEVGPRLGVNRRSILRALWTFNAVIAVQTVTDMLIVLGGADLPRGMNLAEYAHRGAYPLLVTALLAAGVALAARPFLQEHRSISPLLLVWLGQNLVLCAGAMLRLELYVQSYGLTYMRVYAFLWMLLVFGLLALAIWQVLLGLSNSWLIWRGFGAGLVLLYSASFVNFAGVIASYNLSHPDVARDPAYICALGPMAAPAVSRFGTGSMPCDTIYPTVEGWRDWGFRKSRLAG